MQCRKIINPTAHTTGGAIHSAITMPLCRWNGNRWYFSTSIASHDQTPVAVENEHAWNVHDACRDNMSKHRGQPCNALRNYPRCPAVARSHTQISSVLAVAHRSTLYETVTWCTIANLPRAMNKTSSNRRDGCRGSSYSSSCRGLGKNAALLLDDDRGGGINCCWYCLLVLWERLQEYAHTSRKHRVSTCQ
jgi:hypothetical protein